MVEHANEEGVVAEGRLQPDVLLVIGKCKVSTGAVRNYVIDVLCNSTAGAWFSSIKSEEAKPGRETK